MSKTVVNSFVTQFVAAIKGDNVEATAEKAWRSAESALKVQLSSLEGDSIKLEDAVESAKEKLAACRINKGVVIENRDVYVSNLIEAKNYLVKQEKALSTHIETLKFLQDEYDALRK